MFSLSGFPTQRALRFVYWFLVIVLVARAVPRVLQSVKAANPVIKPYTVTLEEYLEKQDGSAEPGTRITIAVRSDGSRVIVAGGKTPSEENFEERILTLSSGKVSYIFEHMKQKSTTVDSSRRPIVQSAETNCELPGVAQRIEAIENVGPYRAVRISIGPITQWFALDHGCALVKEVDDWGSSGKGEKKLVSLVPGEPTASLFHEPAEFEEVPPSVLFPDAPRAVDAYYFGHRP